MKTELFKTDNPVLERPFDWGRSGSGFVDIEGESYFRIERLCEMPPFLINLVSANNHWMFIASNGALTAGRRDADNALFPYVTQDKLFELAHTVGSVSLVWVNRSGYESARFWEPFRGLNKEETSQRNLYKNAAGNKLMFEEVNLDLGLRYRYLWTFSDRFGFARKVQVENLSDESASIRVLDGIQNVVPYGLDRAFVNEFSNLADAYKRCELLSANRLGVYYLSSIPTDRAEPSEGLRATIVWHLGLDAKAVLLSATQVEAFRNGESLSEEVDIRGRRGAYLVEGAFDLQAKGRKDWWVVGDINQDGAQIESMRSALELESIRERLEVDIEKNVSELRRKVASADGLSLTSDRIRDSRHYSNTLFNIMRGGVFNDGYTVEMSDFINHVDTRNRVLSSDLKERLEESFEGRTSVSCQDLCQWAEDSGDSHLVRLAYEYLPLTFSRRHGDPSRPWNRFSIDTQDKFGNPILGYEGNWRDIFQNWEALAYSHPGYLDGMIMRFLNSTTADGYNPYRITRDGIDWETIEAESPWSNIGYWGDHQIVYLLKLLEASKRFHPNALRRLLDKRVFTYAQVPYRIRSFTDIWRNPRETVDFCDEDAASIDARCSAIGSDGKLLMRGDGAIVEANLVEKLLVPLLSKLSNFVPDGGIWMNTQRPEWNDANNALVGYGVSMVTLCYINRYVDFLLELLAVEKGNRTYSIDVDVAGFLLDQDSLFRYFEERLANGFDSESRIEMVRAFGESGEAFRNGLYDDGLSGSLCGLSNRSIIDYLRTVKKFIVASIDANRRPDGLYHSYNLLNVSEGGGLELDRLSDMLEGQVAALSSGRLSGEEALTLLDSLRESALYREDVKSYLLYPDSELPGFLEKNVIANESVEKSRLLFEMLDRKDLRIVLKDVAGRYRFNGDFRNADDLKFVLDGIRKEYSDFASDEAIAAIESIFEDTFNHRQFTGRSSTFFAYEGLGSVYWHMVSKLVLAIQENITWADKSGSSSETAEALASHYYESLDGLGFYRSPPEYGAFPIDAYSHTPKHAGAQQPGMTGQVKEDILIRFGELGLIVENGQIRFDCKLLRKGDFLKAPATFDYLDPSGIAKSRAMQSGELAFTFCQTLFVFRIGKVWKIELFRSENDKTVIEGAKLSFSDSQHVFARTRSIEEVEVTIPESALIRG